MKKVGSESDQPQEVRIRPAQKGSGSDQPKKVADPTGPGSNTAVIHLHVGLGGVDRVKDGADKGSQAGASDEVTLKKKKTRFS